MQTQQDMPKELVFRLRLDDHDRKRLDALAAHYELSAAQTVRTLLKERARELGVEPAGPKPRNARSRAGKR